MSNTLQSSSNITKHAEQPHLERKLNKLNMIAMTFAILNTWMSQAGTLGLVLPSGGSISLLYGFIFCVACNFCLTASLGELASIWPTAGGQYHYSYMLASKDWKKAASFWVGWMSIFGWITLVTTAGFFCALFINAGIIMATNGAYTAAPWKTYLIFVGIVSFVTLLNLYGNNILDIWNNTALMWSILGFLVISITLLATSEKNSAEYVFADWENTTGWGAWVAWTLGMLQSALSFIGADAATHMSEEMPNPSRDTPQAMMYSIGVGGVTGLCFIIVVLFCIEDVTTVLASSTGMPITDMIFQSTGSRAAATILTFMLAISFVCGTNGASTTTSRLIYAMARDEGTPFSSYFSKLDPKRKNPFRAIIASFTFNIFFGLLYLGPSVAFNSFIASSTIFLNLSYAGPIVVLMIRGRNVLKDEICMFKLGGLGYLCNVVGVIYVAYIAIFFCFPVALPTTTGSMNYVCIVVAGFLLFITFLWFTRKNRFQGPDLQMIIGVNAGTGLPVEEEVMHTKHDVDVKQFPSEY